MHARQTYSYNFNTEHFEFNDDIRKISPSLIPDHDILYAGFPCQSFSQAGLESFDDGNDSERGNLFFCILDIIEAKKPKALYWKIFGIYWLTTMAKLLKLFKHY